MISTDLKIPEQVLKLATQDMVDVIYDTLEIIDHTLRSAKIDYTIFCGTMLGSYRHGGLIL
jgi:phosphorylcholine metabolism protein LicD